jgi:hypothetical protein
MVSSRFLIIKSFEKRIGYAPLDVDKLKARGTECFSSV